MRAAVIGGGKLAIETGQAGVDSIDSHEHPDFMPGRYVRLAVRDSGIGMAPEVKQHIFEPFFSTKETGARGLGLAVVDGIIKQSGGHISVDSDPGSGTCFKIYLPRAVQPAREAESPSTCCPQTHVTSLSSPVPVSGE
jgi:signal transduction histidine kinase